MRLSMKLEVLIINHWYLHCQRCALVLSTAACWSHVLLGCDAFELAPYSPFIYCDWVCLFSFL